MHKSPNPTTCHSQYYRREVPKSLRSSVPRYMLTSTLLPAKSEKSEERDSVGQALFQILMQIDTQLTAQYDLWSWRK